MLRKIYDQKIKTRKELNNENDMDILANDISSKLGASVTKDILSASLVVKTNESYSYEELNPILQNWYKCDSINPSYLYNIMPLLNNTIVIRL